ncbi:5'-nucleotidase domain-containing protein 1 [Cimex lectularius]|uniref:5'-nucleotidase domain-containing protein 1 n=1 Tax=Cimex lectularius TaxID=79782 RepID=A0A8I6RWI2_CIMLE|nr:5'-nucleotidase domain-containing protein 1 [Cimex lectularius]
MSLLFKKFYLRNINICKRFIVKNPLTRFSSTQFLRMDFSLFDYDCIGFDLDNTICEYNIGSLVRMEYRMLTEFLARKGYPGEAFRKELNEDDVDFLQRGLLLDFARGNVLKLSKACTVLKGYHGTRMLTEKDIKKDYGDKETFDFLECFKSDMTKAWEPENQTRYRLLLDYFDMPASLAFANCVDFVNASGGETYTKCGQDVIEGLRYMFGRENFAGSSSTFFKELKTNPKMYINPCSKDLLNWLRVLKSKKILFLLTGSNADYANFTAKNCIGDEWREFFNIVVCFARKPIFFTQKNPFLVTENLQETQTQAMLSMDQVYSQGNWEELYEFFKKTTGKDKPKCIYFGDNLVEDVYAPFKFNCCDTVAITEELDEDVHPWPEFLSSNKWGSFCDFHSLWPNVMRDNSKLYLPNVRTLATAMEDEMDEIYEY